MRIVVYGVGAVGGVVAAALALAGQECIGIARGARLDALRKNGLRLRSPRGDERVTLHMEDGPDGIDWRADDAILLAMKGQHTGAALDALRAAGVDRQPIFCAQNGVANERAALRMFPNVHGITVMLPAEYVALDEAVCFGTPNFGMFDIGRVPSGTDAADDALAKALSAAGIVGEATPDVLASKYGKLLMNLGNIVEAVLGRGVAAPDIATALRDEGKAVMTAAGIVWRDVGADDPRRSLMRTVPVKGADRVGGSTTQSLLRGAGSVETDYLNGEIALLGRLHGAPAPLNGAVTALAARLARDGATPGSMTPDDLRGALGLG